MLDWRNRSTICTSRWNRLTQKKKHSDRWESTNWELFPSGSRYHQSTLKFCYFTNEICHKRAQMLASFRRWNWMSRSSLNWNSEKLITLSIKLTSNSKRMQDLRFALWASVSCSHNATLQSLTAFWITYMYTCLFTYPRLLLYFFLFPFFYSHWGRMLVDKPIVSTNCKADIPICCTREMHFTAKFPNNEKSHTLWLSSYKMFQMKS